MWQSKYETDIDSQRKQIYAIRDYDTIFRKRNAEMKTGDDFIDEIISVCAISNTRLRMLAEKIVIHEKDWHLNIAIYLKAKFIHRMDFYNENGEVTDKAFECVNLPV